MLEGVLVLTPTRERGLQVLSLIQELAQFTDISCCQADGELSSKVQEAALRSKPIILLQKAFNDQLPNSMFVDFKDLDVLILDEADRLLEVGFSPKIRKQVCLGPKRRQTMVFSATMTTKLDELVEMSLTNPVRLSANPSAIRPATLTEEVVRIHQMHEVNREAVLLALCSKSFTSKVIIFSGTKVAAHRLYIIFGLVGLKAAELHANILQGELDEHFALERKVDFLIATELLVCGIDMPVAKAVINYDCPSQLTSYVHRVSRIARAGREGHAVTFVTDNDRSCLKAIAKRVGSKLKSRTVAQKSISNWSQIIEQMEDKVSIILQEEREEQALRKARMEATMVFITAIF
ncbi:hypothetical protein M0R45_036090 [Rubus argutus]|uniref:Uncharacterized protein n=1 Tax=Rubus argutus TaxID=59490 RepID=A0AAW1VV02_RUBAR